jgi:hypothetical protein
MLLLGEVHTGLLQNSTSVSQPGCARLLMLVLGEQVRCSTRPIAHALSPEILTGVDCQLATGSGARLRGIGTVVSRAAITGGHVLQGSTYVRITKAGVERRLPWSHYLSNPGVVETIGKAGLNDLVTGLGPAKPAPPSLDLGAVSGRLMDAVQSSPELDRRAPFRMTRTKLRWVAVREASDAGSAKVHFAIENDTLRTMHLTVDTDDVLAIAGLCEDLALHEWLLTTLLAMIEASRIGDVSESHVVSRLRPAIDYLLHLWMPTARLEQSIVPLWESLERKPGFTRQWQTMVDRIRDQIALATITLPHARTGEPFPAKVQ